MADYRIVVFRQYEDGTTIPSLASQVFSDRSDALLHRRFYTEILAGSDPAGKKAKRYSSIVLSQAKAHKLLRDFMEVNDKWKKKPTTRAPG